MAFRSRAPRVPDRRFGRPRDCADVVLGRSGGTGLQAGEVGTIRETAPAPVRNRSEESRVEVRRKRTAGLKAKPHPCQRFTPIPSPRIGGQQASPAPAMAPRRSSAARQPNRIVPMSRVGISRCATHAVSRSAQSGGRHNRRSLDRQRRVRCDCGDLTSWTCPRAVSARACADKSAATERNRGAYVGDAGSRERVHDGPPSPEKRVVDTSKPLKRIGVVPTSE